MEIKSLLVIPTYNEVETISKAVLAALEADIHVLVVDDGSNDGTLQAISDLEEQFPARVFSLRRNQKLGLGVAYKDGFSWGLSHSYEIFGEMDADLSHNPKDIPNLIEALSEADLVIGSRYIDGGGTKNWPWYRQFISRTGGIYVRFLTGLPVADPTAGFRFYKRHVLEFLDLSSISATGYAFQVEMALRTWLAGFKIKEVPIIFTERESGVSKMNNSIVLEAIVKVASWVPSSLWGLRKKDRPSV